MGSKFFFKDLLVWQKGIDLTDSVYLATENFPKNQEYVLSSQMQRCAISVPSNIAEGNARKSTKEFERFLYISMGSCAELITQLIIARRRNFISEEKFKSIEANAEEVSRMTMGLIKSLGKNKRSC